MKPRIFLLALITLVTSITFIAGASGQIASEPPDSALCDIHPHLVVCEGVDSGDDDVFGDDDDSDKVWNAYNSWWSWALSAALLLVGLGGFSALIKAMFKGWVKAYGKKAARQIAIRW
jgi:hypothetical protein